MSFIHSDMTWVEKFGGAGADMIGPAGQQHILGVAATCLHYTAIRGPGAGVAATFLHYTPVRGPGAITVLIAHKLDTSRQFHICRGLLRCSRTVQDV
jgi:hypothetical protein